VNKERKKTKRLRLDDKLRIVKLYRDKKLSVKQITDVEGYSNMTIRSVLKEYGFSTKAYRPRKHMSKTTFERYYRDFNLSAFEAAEYLGLTVETMHRMADFFEVEPRYGRIDQKRYKAWTREEVEILRNGREDGLTCRQIAASLEGRFANDVQHKVYELGLARKLNEELRGETFYTTDGKKLKFWTHEEEAELKRLRTEEKLEYKVIAKKMNRSYSSVTKKASALGLRKPRGRKNG